MQVSGILLKTFFAYPESISLEEVVASKGRTWAFSLFSNNYENVSAQTGFITIGQNKML